MLYWETVGEFGTHSVALSLTLYCSVCSDKLWGRLATLNDWLETAQTWALSFLGFLAV